MKTILTSIAPSSLLAALAIGKPQLWRFGIGGRGKIEAGEFFR